MTRSRFLYTLLFLALFASFSYSQDRKTVEETKKACFLVEVSGGESYATAFCIHPSGIVATNFHVVEKLEIGETVGLIANSGSDDQESFNAKLLRVDEKNDLAILKIASGKTFTSVRVASSAELFETMALTAFGFPFGKSLSLEDGGFPTISVNAGKITAIRKNKSEVQLVQLDAMLNPGNSGGPIIDDKGNLVAVVSFGVAGSGVNFGIPSEKLRLLLEKPDVEMKVPKLTGANITSPKKVEVSLTPLLGELSEPTVEFWVKQGAQAPKRFVLKEESKNKFEGTIVGDKSTNTKLINGTLVFTQGKIEGKIADAPIEFGGKSISLSEVESVVISDPESQPSTPPKTAELTLFSGAVHKVDLAALPKLKVDLGNFPATIDVSKVCKVTMTADENAEQISIMLIVKSAGKEIYRSTGTDMERASDIAGSSPDTAETASSTSKIKSTLFKGGPQRIPLPGVVTDAIYAGGGQYLLIVMGTDKKLAVIDVGKGKVEKILPLSSDDVIVVGTMNHIVIHDRKKNIFERYSLDKFTRQLAVKPPFSGVVKSMVAGNASNGPILVHKSVGTDALSQASFTVIDLMKFKELPIKNEQYSGHFSSFRDITHLRASTNGRVFGMWCTSHTPSGVQSMVLTDSGLIAKYEHDSAGHVVPSADGSHILTGAGAYTTGLKRLNQNSRGFPQIPTSHPRFVLSQMIGREPSQPNQSTTKFTINEIGSDTPLFDLPDLNMGELGSNEGWVNHDFTWDKRVYLHFESNALILIPVTNDSVVIQEFNLRKELKHSALDYFFISSTPNRLFTPGKAYSYQIEVESNRKSFEFELSTGPERMAVSKKGKVTWNVPKDFNEPSVDVIVSIANGDSLQTYDTFTLYNANAK